jgi:hypothetical protein
MRIEVMDDARADNTAVAGLYIFKCYGVLVSYFGLDAGRSYNGAGNLLFIIYYLLCVLGRCECRMSNVEGSLRDAVLCWIPAFAGMTMGGS